MKGSDNGITYRLDSLGNTFRLQSYNRLNNIEKKKMLSGFPVDCTLETHTELKRTQQI